MMYDIEELEALIKGIKDAPPCEVHGRKFLEICVECCETVQCTMCEPRSCQCWNDE